MGQISSVQSPSVNIAPAVREQFSASSQQRLEEYTAALAAGSIPDVDVGALVQAVLREAYMENTNDLRFYAEKVKFYNGVKKQIRAELTKARDHMAAHGAGLEDGDTIPGFFTTPINTNYSMADVDPNVLAGTVDPNQNLSGGGLTPFDKSDAPSGSDLANQNLTGYDVVGTESGYTVAYKGAEVRVYDAAGEEILGIWGDPHVQMGGMEDGKDLNADSAFHFGQNSSFVLPDGTKLSLQTTPNSNGEYYTTGVTVMSGENVTQLDGKSGTNVTITDDRAAVDAAQADVNNDASAALFMVTTSGQCLAQGLDGQFYGVKAETWSAYKNGSTDDDGNTTNAAYTVDINTSVAGQITNQQALAMYDGQTVHDVAGGAKVTKADLDAYIQGLEEKLSSVGDDAQLANVDLQNNLQKQQQTMQMMSNMSKMLHDTAMAIIRKIG